MFHLPGGIQLFLLLNFLLLLVGLLGFQQVIAGSRQGEYFSLLLAGAGVFAFAIHSAFILAGNPEFRLPASLAVLAATLIVSAAQAFLAVSRLRS